MRPVGSCGKAHGLRGEVAVYTEVSELFVPGAVLHTPGGDALTVISSRPHQGHLIVAFAEIADRNAAGALRNLPLSSAVDPELAEDEFWTTDLIGRVVRDRAGARLGTVVDVVTAPAQDRLVVDTGDRRVEIPFVSELVPEVADTHITVDPPDGLFG